jgi:hypothetical protein
MFLAAALALAAAPVSGPAPGIPKVLDLFQQLQTAEKQKAGQKPISRVHFQLTETEVNDYARHALQVKPRPGVQSLTVRIFPRNYYSTHTVIDFDAIERWKPGTIPMLLKPILSGQKSILVDYRVETNAGMARLEVEKASFEGIPLPAFLVQKIIEVVAARQPEHYDTSKPVPLPLGLRKVWTEDKVVMGEN